MNLIALREKHGLTQAEFWNRLGMTQSCGSRYEKGNRPISEPVSLLLTIAYGNLREARRVVDILRK